MITKITPEMKDTLIGLSGIVFAICAGIWTLFNYDASERKTEIEALLGISKQLVKIKLEASKPDKSSELTSMLREAYITTEFKFQQIKKPWCTSEKKWMTQWDTLYLNLKKASSDGWDSKLKCRIDSSWREILRMKEIKRLGDE